MNTSQPRSRLSVSDQTIAPPSAPNAASGVSGVSGPNGSLVRVTARPIDRAEVEVLPVSGQTLGKVRATVMVRAAAERVRAVLFDFPNYPAFLPNYKSAKVVGTTPAGATLVQMEIDALGGMIRRSMRLEFSPATVEGPRETFTAHLVDGNVKAFEARWILDRLDDGTRLTVESFLDANLQLPSSFLDAGNAAGVKEAVLNIKARAEESSP